MEEGLKINLGVDADKLDKSFAAAQQKIDDFVDRMAASFLGANFDNVNKEIDQLSFNISDLQKRIQSKKFELVNEKDLTKIAQLNKEIESIESVLNQVENHGKIDFLNSSDLNRAQNSIRGANNALGTLPRTADRATMAMTDLSRVVQDAPYGFIGISNNLNPLLESFQRLQKESGSTTGALKAILSSLTGAGGIGLALSAVSAGFSFATLGMSAWTRGFGSNKKAVDSTTESNKKYLDSVNAITSGYAAEQTKITSLIGFLKSETATRLERASALKQLQQIDDQYFGHLKDEEGLVQKLERAYAAYTTQIKNAAILKAINKKLEPLFQQLLEAQLEVDPKFLITQNDELIAAQQRATKRIGKEVDDFNKTINDGFKEISQPTGKSTPSAVVDVFSTKESINNIKKIQAQIDALINFRKPFDQFFDIKPEKEGKEAKEKVKKVIEYIHQGLGAVEIPLSVKEAKKKIGIEVREIFHGIQEVTKAQSFGDGTIFGEKAIEGYRNFKKYWEDQAKKNPLRIDVNVKMSPGDKANIDDFANSQREKLMALQDTVLTVADNIAGPLSNAFTGLFQKLATEGTLSIKDLGDSVKQLAIDFVTAALRALVLSAVIKLVSKSFGGGGFGSFGSILSGLLSGGSPTGMATGGIVPPGYPNDSFPARLSSNEAVIPLDRLDSIMGRGSGNGGVLTARVSGNDLLFILNRAGRSNGRSF